MKNISLVLGLMILVISCQKEISSDVNPGNGGGTGGPGGGGTGPGNLNGKLVRTVSVTGTDTMTSVYTYDAQGRVETQTEDGSSGGMVLHNYKKFERDATGRIVRILQVIDQNGMAGDTAINIIHYPNATTMEFDYSVNTMSLMGMTTVDSTVYTFSGGKMLSSSSFMSSSFMGPTAFPSSRMEYTYDAQGRVSLLKMYAVGSVPGSPLSHIANQTFAYGPLLSPGHIPSNVAQKYFIGGFTNATDEAVNRHQIEDLSGTPGISRVMTWTFVTSGNKAVTATMTSTSGQVTKYSFFYQ
jgi:hypothetical protein